MPRGGFSGGGGGGRISGGGGGRLTGGRSGGGGGRGGFTGGGFPTGGGFGGGRIPPGGGFGGGGFHGGGYRGGGFFFPFGGGYRRNYRGGGGCGTGCSSIFVVIAVIIVALVMTFGSGIFSQFGSYSAGTGNSSGIAPSTVKRTPLPKGSVNETGYYTDELGWIKNPVTLEAGMKNFYNKTGVQPYIYITDTVNGTKNPTDTDMETYVNELYNKLFKDEAHFLVLYWETKNGQEGDYKTWYTVGSQAKSVVDLEAANIVLDYIDRYYYDNSLQNYDQVFSKSFNDAANRIMTVTVSPWVYVIAVLVVLVILALLFYWWARVKKQKNLEAEQTEKILNTPLEELGPGPTGIEDKYKDPPK